jgi:ABC-type multidrug transport system fused ATPase/permease subunit
VKEDVEIIEDKARKRGKEIGKEFEKLGKDIEKSFQSGTAKAKSESDIFSKRAERKAKQMEQDLKESLSKKDNPIFVFFKVLGIIVMGSLFTAFLILFLISLFFSAQVDPYLSYITYTEADKWLFYLLMIGLPFMLFWSFGISFIKMFTGKNIALSVVQGITVVMWVSVSVSILFLGYHYSKNFRNKTLISKEVFMVNQSELPDRIQIRNAAKPLASKLISKLPKLLTQGDTLFIQNVSYKITQSEDTLLRVFAEAEVYQNQTSQSNSLPLSHPGLEIKNNILYLPSFIRLQAGEKWQFRSLTYHIQVPKGVEHDAVFWQE